MGSGDRVRNHGEQIARQRKVMAVDFLYQTLMSEVPNADVTTLCSDEKSAILRETGHAMPIIVHKEIIVRRNIRVPKFQCSVEFHAGQRGSIGGEGHRADSSGVAAKGSRFA